MIETAANLAWQAMSIASAAALVAGAALCAVQTFYPEGRKVPAARRALKALGAMLRKASFQCEHLAYRLF